MKLIQEYTSLMLLFQTTMPLAVTSQAMIRIFFPLFDSNSYVVLRSLIEKFYDKNENLPEEQSAMNKCLRRLVKVIVILFALNFFCVFGPLAFSLYKTLETGHSAIPYPIILPFVDLQSTFGFILNFSNQTVLTAYAISGFVVLDGQAFLYVLHTQVFVDGLSSKRKRLSEYMMTTDVRLLGNRTTMRKMLLEIFEAHAELKEYGDWLQKFMGRLAFIVVTLNTYVFCSSGILFLTSIFYGGIGLIFQSFVSLLMYCGLGAYILSQHERLLDELWKFEWYKLPISEQKDWLNFLTKAQQPFHVKVIFIGLIDLELFIKVNFFMLSLKIYYLSIYFHR